MAQHYAFQQYGKDHMARASSKDVPISFKQSIEICSHLRYKSLQDAKSILERVLQLKQAIPFRRFQNGLGHKPGMASGRYPINACSAFLKLLNSVEANAQQKGLNTSNLKLVHLIAQQATRPFHYSRHRGRQMKAAHLEVVVEERKSPAKEQKQRRQQAQQTPRQQPGQQQKATPAPEALA